MANRQKLAKGTGAVRTLVRWGIIPAGALGVAVVAGLFTGTTSSATIMAALADPLSVLSARSPGARPAGALTQTKQRRVAHGRKGSGPSERVLSNVLTRPLNGLTPGDGGTVPGIVAGPDPSAFPVTDAPVGAPVASLPPGGSVIPPGSPGIFIPGAPGSGGGGGGGGVTPAPDATPTPTPTGVPTGTPTGVPTGTPTGVPTGTPTGVPTGVPTVTPTGVPTVPVTPAVPEPATWVLLMLGFGMVGMALRRRSTTGSARDRVLSD